MTELHDKAPPAWTMAVLGDYKRNAALVRRIVDEIWNAGDIDLADQLFSSTYVNHGGLIPDLVAGPEGIKLSVALYHTAFPGLHIRVDSLTSIKGAVHMRWTAQMTDHRRDAEGSSNVEHGFSGATRSRAADGQVVESWTSWDSTDAMWRLKAFQSSSGEGSR